MRIAVMMSGLPRYIDRNKKLMEGFYGDHEVDYFVHAWFDPEKENEDASWHSYKTKIDKAIPEKINKYYAPKKQLLERQRDFYVPREYHFNTGWPQPNFVAYSHFYSLKRVNELRKQYERENNIKYDMVVKHRFDVYIACEIKWEEYDLNSVYLPDNCNVWTELYDDVQFNDMFAFSKPENMDVYCSPFDRIDELYTNNFLRFSCENFLTYVLLEKDINVVPLRFNRSFILREVETYDLHWGRTFSDEEELKRMRVYGRDKNP